MNSYVQACLVIEGVSEEDRDWLERVHAALQRYLDPNSEIDQEDRAYADFVFAGREVEEYVGFDFASHDAGNGRYDVLLGGNECVNTVLLAWLAQAYLRHKRDETGVLSFAWAMYSDSYGHGHSGGGTMVVSHNKFFSVNTEDLRALGEHMIKTEEKESTKVLSSFARMGWVE